MSAKSGRKNARLAGRAETIRRLWKQNGQIRDFAGECLIDEGELRGAIFRLAQQVLSLDKQELQKYEDLKAVVDKVWGEAPATHPAHSPTCPAGDPV